MNRENNFDILRLLAAYLVLFSHSYAIFDRSKDPLFLLTGQISLSDIALATFFIISGYLISGSYLKKPDLKIFFKKRVLRILPGLTVVILISTLILGPVVTNFSAADYFLSSETWKYLNGILIIPLEYNLPGVFESNPYENAVNGSLWSLELEVKCYFLIALFGLCSVLKPRFVFYFSVFLLVVFLICVATLNPPKRFLGLKFTDIKTYSEWMYYFFAGSLLYLARDKIKYNQNIFLTLLLLTIITCISKLFATTIFMISMPYIIIYLANNTQPISKKLRGNDISYGVYIYAFPIQQTYMHYFGVDYGFSVFVFTCSILALFFGYASWKLVEEPCLKLKSKKS